MITKQYKLNDESSVLTLQTWEITDNDEVGGYYSKFDKFTGWTIGGFIAEDDDHKMWVVEFDAEHPTFGKVWGDFDDEVYADSEEGLANFWAGHAPSLVKRGEWSR